MFTQKKQFRRERSSSEEKLFNFRPIFFSSVFLCFGIVFCYMHLIHGISLLWLLLLLPIMGLPFCFCRERKQLSLRACSILLLGISFFMGFFLFFAQLTEFSDCKSYSGVVTVTGRVTNREQYDHATQVFLTDLNIEGEWESGTLVAYLPPSFYEEITLSDVLMLEGNILTNAVYVDKYGFRASAIAEEYRYSILTPKNCFLVGHETNPFAFVRMRLEKALYRGMDDDGAAVAMALLLGNTSGIAEDLYENVRKGGVAHIFAVSGLHVGALFAFCMLLVQKTALRKTPKLLRFIIVATLLVLYAALCGFSASVVRATILCLVDYGGKLLKTQTDLLQTLGLAAIVILLASPVALFEVGFQLSFVACLGIALLKRPFERTLSYVTGGVARLIPKKRSAEQLAALELGDTLPPTLFERMLRGTVSFLSVSFAAQTATAPILLYTFGYVSSWALLLNCLFVPFVGLVFSALLLLAFVACLLPLGVSTVLLYVPNVVWSAALLLFEAVDFSSFAITGLHISIGACILYYLACTFLSDKWNVKRGWKICLVILCCSGFFATMVALNV